MSVIAIGEVDKSVIAERKRDLRLGSFSDVHLGHHQTPTSLIIENLRKEIPDTPETGELDLLLMGGDLFDESLSWTDDRIPEIEDWLFSLAVMCSRRKIVLRFLEGTSSHDRRQSRHMAKLIERHGIQLDYKYIPEVAVEVIESLGISMLYIPDLITDPEKIWGQVQQAMAEAGLEQVDYANIHGQFAYQMPNIASVQANCHPMERYLKIVKNYIFSGHIHFPSTYDRIFCNGSFDRLNHGEEEAKGHWRALIRQNGEDEFVFHVTENAAVYRSIDCTGWELEPALAAAQKLADALPKEASIRIVADRGNPILVALPRLRQDYPFIRWTNKAVDTREVKPILERVIKHETVSINAGNIVELLMPRIREKNDNPVVISRCLDLLKDMAHEHR